MCGSRSVSAHTMKHTTELGHPALAISTLKQTKGKQMQKKYAELGDFDERQTFGINCT